MILISCTRHGARTWLQFARQNDWHIVKLCGRNAARISTSLNHPTNTSAYNLSIIRSLHVQRQNIFWTTSFPLKGYPSLPCHVFYASSSDSSPNPNSTAGNSSQSKTTDSNGSQNKSQQIGDPPGNTPVQISFSPPSSSKKDSKEIIIKVQATKKVKPKTDFTQIYTANIYIPVARAMNDYLLESSELDNLASYTRRSPYPERDNIIVYRRRDLEQRAVDKWGSLENLQLQKDYRKARHIRHKNDIFHSRLESKDYMRVTSSSAASAAAAAPAASTATSEGKEKPLLSSPSSPTEPTIQSIFQVGSGRVVLYAIAINAANCVMKFVAWLYTGSHSMFSEFIHSFADTMNQIILAAGIRQSLKKPDLEHPYGWANFRNVASLISGVGIFCVGSGLSLYHGIIGLMYPAQVTSLFWALATLSGSLLSEGATLLVAINEIRQSSQLQKISFFEYVIRGRDPSTNVVLLEDAAAVVGIIIAASCIGITHYTGHHVADACGSLLIGTLLGGVASFIIYSNTLALVGKSIPAERRMELMKDLESDRMIRTIHDLKATDVGGRFIRFKAEVDFDGREITRYYLEQQDLEKMLLEMNGLKTMEEAESFMLRHGENIVDTLGGEVDRIEKNLKKKHPEIRHCDLEQL